MNIDFLKEALKINEELIKIRRDLHENPELGFEEWKTSEKIKNFLQNEGIPYITLAKTGVCGIIEGTAEGASEGKVIALRADIDALPIQDKKVCDYRSKIEGKMHACGHDAHTTILLGTAKLLNKHKHLLKGKVKLLFEPAEETTGGSRVMISEGVLEDPRVDAIVGLHVTEDLEAGKVKIKNGVVNAASNPFTIKIKGKGGHGAAPNTTVDPVVMASQVVLSLQTIVSREISPFNPAVITIGSIQGGTAQNIIPDEVILKGIIRTMSSEDREHAKRRLEEIVKGVCTAMRGNYEIEIEESYPCLYNDDYMVDRIREAAKIILGEENVGLQENPRMWVESFAYFANERPAGFFLLGSGNNNKAVNAPIHNALFDIDEQCLHMGVAVECLAAYNYLTE